MTIKEFKEFCDNLGRFASIRERKEPGPKNTTTHKHRPFVISYVPGKEHQPTLFACSNPDFRGNRCSKVWRAEELNMQYDPTDVVLVQAVAGQLKMVAGTVDSTIIVTAGPTAAKGKVLVEARTLLNAAKALRGKGDVEFGVDPGKSLTIRVSTGAEMTLPNSADALPHWLKPPTETPGDATFPAKWMTEAAKVVSATTSAYWPGSHVHLSMDREYLRLSCTDGAAFATTYLPGEDDHNLLDAVGSVSSVFINAIKNLGDAGTIRWSSDLLSIQSGPYLAVTQLYRVPAPIKPLSVEPPETTVVVDRKVLTDMVKAVASNDEHNRVALVARNAALTVHPFDSRQASVKVPAEVVGADLTVGVDAVVLERLLKAAPGKTVSLGWSEDRSPVQFTDKDSTWRMLLAPVVL